METAAIWVTIAGMAVAAYANRASFILLAGKLDLPPPVRRALRYVPSSVLPALIVPALLMPAGTMDLTPGNERLWAGLAAALVAWRWQNVVLVIATGMGTLHLLRFIERLV